MKLMIAFLLTVVIFAGFHESAQGRNLWVKVQGGTWMPDAATELKIRDGLERYVKSKAPAIGRPISPWNSYTFQYRGETARTGRRFVFINAFCGKNDYGQPLDKYMVVVFDGGTCFFNVKYDPSTGEFFELRFNGQG